MSQAASILSTTPESEIRSLIQSWSRALSHKDLEALTSAYTEDAVLFDIKPPYKLTGPASIRQMWAQCLPYFPESFNTEHLNLHITASETLAFVHGLHKISTPTQPSHPANNFHCRITLCFQKIDGQWRTTHEHVSVPYNPMTGQITPITNPNDLSCPSPQACSNH